MKIEISRQIFEKYANMWFDGDTSSDSRGVPCERADGHSEANSHISYLMFIGPCVIVIVEE